MRNKFKTQGVWKKFEEYPNTRALCLQIVVARPTEKRNEIAGVVGGYCGSDLFCLEQFLAKKTPTNNIKSLWIGSEDAITGQEIDFNTLSPDTLTLCQEALEEVWEWNSENNWLESQQLRLYPYCLEGLKNNQGILQTKPDIVLSNILKAAGQHLMLVNPNNYKIKTNTKKKSKTNQIKEEINLD